MTMKIEQAHPFYRAAWRRWLIVGSTIVWSLFEWFVARDPFWGVIALAFTGYAVWALIYTFPAETETQPTPGKKDQD